MRKRYTVASICLVLLLALGLFALLGIPPLVRQAVLQSIPLDQQRVETWGQNPGHSKTVTMRNYTFHNLTNPRAYLYNGQKPRFHQITNYHLQERTNFTNLAYSEDKSVVYFNYWLHFTQLETSRSLEEYVHVLNLGPLGYWKQCETVDISWVAIQGFGGLFFELNGSMKAQAIGKGVASQYLKDYSSLSSNLCIPMELSSEACLMLWADPTFGLQDENHYKLWVNWALYDSLSDGAKIAQYFGFSKLQLISFKQTFSFWCRSMSSILQNWYCNGQPCSSYEMMITQLSTSTITSNPPSGDPQPSICLTGNITCSGWPELNAFYKNEFEPKQIQARFKNMTFSKQTLRRLFTPYTGVLLNVGNLSQVFHYGWPYDRNNSDTDNLARLRAVTAADSDEQAVVIWEYLKYFVYEFVSKNSQGGSRKLSGLGQAFNKYLYITYNKYYEWLPREYISMLVADAVGNCTQFISVTIEGISLQKAQSICGNASRENYREYYRLVQPCNNQLLQEDILNSHNLTMFQKSQYCQQTDLSMRTVLDSVHKKMHQWFNCTTNKLAPRCSFQQLTLLQFFDSALTLRPIPNSVKNYTPTTTAHHWNPDLGEWEYRHFLNQVYGDPFHDKQEFTYQQKADLLSFDKLFSNPIFSKIYILQDDKQLKKLLYWQNRTLLREWARFFTIQVAFGGLIQKRTVRQLLFGYEDPFLNEIKHQDLMRGGDPSRDPVLSLNQPNQTLQEAQKYVSSMYSGFGDPYQTRNFITKDNQTFIYYIKNIFDGYNALQQKATPFKQFIPLKGTDGTQSKPLTEPDQYIYVYVDAMKRITEMNLKQQTQRYGFKARRYRPTDKSIASSKVQPANDVYYQGFTGLNNVSFKGAPIFIGGNHFRKTDPEDDWTSKVEFYDESGTYPQFTSSYDDSQLVMEPNSGATFTATTYLQTNLYFPTDLLFPNPPTMLPLFTVYRSGNMSEEIANQLLGPLMIGLKAPKIIAIVCGVGMAIVIASIYICHRRLKVAKDTPRTDPSLIQSLNSKEDNDQKQINPETQEIVITQQKKLVEEPIPPKQQFKFTEPIREQIKQGALNETIHVQIQQQRKSD